MDIIQTLISIWFLIRLVILTHPTHIILPTLMVSFYFPILSLSSSAIGYYNVRSDLFIAKLLHSGKLDQKSFAIMRQVEEYDDVPPNVREATLKPVLEKYPNLPHALLLQGRILMELGRYTDYLFFNLSISFFLSFYLSIYPYL